MMPAENQTTGMNIGFPDVCITPAAPSPIPVPYPNLGAQAMSTIMCPTILVTMTPAHTMMSKPAMTNGDNAGVAHATVMGSGGTTMGNPKVLLQGQPAGCLCVPTTGNNYNNPLGAQVVPSVTTVLYTYCPTNGVTDRLAEELADPYPGLGVSTQPVERGQRVLHVRRDGLAHRLGVEAGDVLVAVDGRSLRADVPLPRPAVGDRVRLDLLRGTGQEVSVEGIQTHVPAAIDGELCGQLGTVQIRRFDSKTAARVRATVAALVGLGAEALTLDLRGCPGGALSAAVETASLFLAEGLPVVFVEQGEAAVRVERSRGGAVTTLPLSVLVDDQTASAAEILAAALVDHGRAKVLGEPTFGKGVGLEVSAHGSLRAHLLRPSGESLTLGVRPS